MHWLAIQFPRLGVELRERVQAEAAALAMVDAQGSAGTLLQVNATAFQAGLRTGMTTARALAMLPELQLCTRDPAAEVQALSHWARLLYSLAPRVVLLEEMSPALAVDISGNTRLQQDDTLLQVVAAWAAATRLSVHAGVAPTPLGAALLAQWQGTSSGSGSSFCPGAVDWALLWPRIPITLLPYAAATHAALLALGVRHCAQLQALDRADLVRRLGPESLHVLDRLSGRIDDPRPALSFPMNPEVSIPLYSEIRHWEGLRFALHRALQDLQLLLRTQAQASRSWLLQLQGRERQWSSTLEVRDPSTKVETLLTLWQWRLQQQPLDFAVHTLHLQALAPHHWSGRQTTWWQDEAEEARWQLVEQLRQRLGDVAVYAVAGVADHRPDYAWQRVPPGAGQGEANAARPLWLLAQALPLHAPPLLPPAQVERIEGGWWDGRDQSRDYFRWRHPGGALCWVYRDRRQGRFYVQGYFA
ncbi:Y-family DNA polymerase [Acidithiobacillus ferridurans]|uniref:Y-family DNA polymerase n=1 Tax=Acidithiobacillus ferridurans TaxID=1232575 RepID=UPI001C06C04D|nr:DNA polymerase Y family protein [Acidithiobacillus ferridurans]MBU2732264.1 DNA polymerase Y family protein [Acidithiobacillus ferridurans]